MQAVNIDIKQFVSDKYNEIKDSLASELLNHPRFEESFSKEATYILYKTGNPDMSFFVSFDKKSVSINSYNALFLCSVDKLRGENKTYISSKLYLNNDNLYIEYSEGVVYDRKKLEESGLRTFATYESKLETMYSLKCFNKLGFEYSNSSYSDSYPLNKKINDVDIREQTLSSFHKPTFYEYLLPKASIHVLNAQVRNTYRKEGSYAIIHTNLATITKDGYKDTACALFTVHPMYPELLRGDKTIAKAIEQNGQFTFIMEESYEISVERAYERAKKELKENIEKRKNDFKPEVYDFLINNV